MPPKKRFLSCEICGERICRRDREKRKFMAKFPLDESRCRQWVKYVGKEDLVYVPIEKLHALKYVCCDHFERRAFNKKNNRLKKSAVPSKNLKFKPLPDAMLLEFPCHIFSENEVSMPQVEASTEFGHIDMFSQRQVEVSTQSLCMDVSYNVSQEPCMPVPGLLEITIDNVPEVLVSENATLQCEDEVTVGPCNSEQSNLEQPHLIDHDYCTKREEHLQPIKRKLLRAKRKVQSHLGQSLLVDHDHYIQKEETLQTKTIKKKCGSDSKAPSLQITPRKRKLMKKIRLFKRKINVLRKGDIMARIKSIALKTLIRAYIRNHGRKPQGKRWTSTEKALAIAIYKKSPRAYRHLSRIIALPSIRTLQGLLQAIVLEPGISPTILQHLKKKAEKMNEKDKLCALLFDEIALKKRLIYNQRSDKIEGFVDLGENQYRSSDIADHALVFMLQGLHKKLKQPIAYYFVKGTISSQSLAVLIKENIRAVADTGFTVINTVCDQGPTNIGSLNLLKEWSNVPASSNFFLLDGKKIYIMFDIPHLFKSLRNNFHNGGVVEIDGKRGQWSHLREAAEKNERTLHFRKLTALHVNPTYRTKMKVKLAAQVLSNTVAAILKCLSENLQAAGDDVKAKEIADTADIVEDMDNLFDCTNGPTSRKDVIKDKRENVSKKTNHIQKWRNYKEKIKTMVFLKKDSFLRLKNIRCVQGYETSLSSLEDIWKTVEIKGFKYLNLRQLNQDSLENLFGMIRQHCPTNRNPTCHHFTAALKSNILTKLSSPVGRGANCEEDDNQAIIDFDDFFHNIETENVQMEKSYVDPPVIYQLPNESESPILHITENDDLPDDFAFPDDEAEYSHMQKRMFESFEKQPTVYVAGYLASVVLKKIPWKCDECNSSLKTDDPNAHDTRMYSYIKLREWWQDKKSLTYPTWNLCKLVDIGSSCFEDDIKPKLHENHVCQQAVTMILAKCDNLLWICGDHKDRLLHILLVRLAQLLIRNECNRINLSFAKSEETTAEIIKKAQQQGTAK